MSEIININKHDNIVKYHSDLNLVQFKNFNSSELNIFFTICSIMKERDLEEVELTFSDLFKLTGIASNVSKSKFIDLIYGTYYKMSDLKFKIGSEDSYIKFLLFPGFDIDLVKNTVTMQINKDFKYILNKFTEAFTKFELQEYNSLKSKYAKELYRQLKGYRTIGERVFKTSELKNIMGLSEDYPTAEFTRRVVNVALKEVSQFIKKLECEKIKNKAEIIEYKFTFKPERFESDSNI